ncbi:cation efflux system protein CusA [Ichthyobacterium seriolicida]|uniref:Cation efflux system protein CusA n=2 Tax=Ichthyobacterium seriolicida TaxID=242600 RepID=A0A1J1E975_9FLAO|nr:cation efflux system protein CusA [Ichthyobacterium seriolicida]
MFGLSSIYIIFEEDVEFYWSRSRILEKLNSLPNGLLPTDTQPALGPDATGLGQIFWYTLEGRNDKGKPTGGWDLQELRSIQDYYVKYGLSSVSGVSEIASIGGFVKEYQVDINVSAMKAHNISLMEVVKSVKNANRDVGAKTIEINKVEYLVRGLGYIKKIDDIEQAVVKVDNNIPLRIKDIAKVSLGPTTRRGVLDKSGSEAVGGVVISRFGANPMEVIKNIKKKIDEISTGLPTKKLSNGDISKITIVPFYDRSTLIQETLNTLEEALSLEVLITILVVIIMMLNFNISIIVSSLLPLSILMVFIAMKYTGVDANIVALSGIAIAIGTMVDMGIILSENILRHLRINQKELNKENIIKIIYKASTEVSPAILTAVLITIISFIPIFSMEAAEGKLFRPLAYTKTYALIASLLVCLIAIPSVSYVLFRLKFSKYLYEKNSMKIIMNILLSIVGLYITFSYTVLGGISIMLFSVLGILKQRYTENKFLNKTNIIISVSLVTYILSNYWSPLGLNAEIYKNFLFVSIVISFILGAFLVFIKYYENMLNWALDNKKKFLSIPVFIVVLGITIWLGFSKVFFVIPKSLDLIGYNIRINPIWSMLNHTFPGTQKEFMPSLDEGSFLLMPTSMPHSGIEENTEILKKLDIATTNIPEVKESIGKAGRIESPLDPSPISMYENIINYKDEYALDEHRKALKFATDENGLFLRKNDKPPIKSGSDVDIEDLILDDNGTHYRQWRDKIKSKDDIWKEIVNSTRIPGVTSAPKLQPIETRLIMLQTGIPAPIGIAVKGPDIETIEKFALELESIIKEVPSVKKESVFTQRITGKPYIELDINRIAISRYGLTVEDIQQYVEIAIGGMKLGNTVEGRERYPIRVRYPRENRDSPESIGEILVSTKNGTKIPLSRLVDIKYKQGPPVIKSEDTFLVGYVLLDKEDGFAEVNSVDDADKIIREKISDSSLKVPQGVSYRFIGNYENQMRAEKKLSLIIPLIFLIIFVILYFQFSSISTSLMVFSGIAVAFSGGFLMIWLYGQEWFLNFSIFDNNIRDIFQIRTINLSVAVWVGFIALFGIATDDGVVMATYLEQSFKGKSLKDISEIRKCVIQAGKKRIRPCLMTTATTLLALLPILTSSGKGSDIMIPMAIPSFGGMSIAIITLFVVPVLYSMWKEKNI